MVCTRHVKHQPAEHRRQLRHLARSAVTGGLAAAREPLPGPPPHYDHFWPRLKLRSSNQTPAALHFAPHFRNHGAQARRCARAVLRRLRWGRWCSFRAARYRRRRHATTHPPTLPPPPPRRSDTRHNASLFRLHAGYERRFWELQAAVAARFPGAPLAFSSEGTPQATGWFEVFVNGTLVFSKKSGGGARQRAGGRGDSCAAAACCRLAPEVCAWVPLKLALEPPATPLMTGCHLPLPFRIHRWLLGH